MFPTAFARRCAAGAPGIVRCAVANRRVRGTLLSPETRQPVGARSLQTSLAGGSRPARTCPAALARRLHAMHRLPALVLLVAAAATAQDHIIPFGFAANTGGNGGTSSMPAARIKDNDLDGQISSVTELHSFLTTAFYAGTNAQGTVLPQICFMTDVRAVVV